MGSQRDRDRMAAVMASARERLGTSPRRAWPRTQPPKHTVLAGLVRGCRCCEKCEAAQGQR